MRRTVLVSVGGVVGMLGALGGAVVVATRLAGGRYMRVAVAGESMTPTLRPGEFLVLRRGAPPRESAYGQVVAVYDPRPEMRLDSPRLLLKRIVGLPGEALRIGGGVQINGRVLDEPYAHGETPYEQHRGINRLEADEYFLVGDHRGASTDSRDFGPVTRDAIVGTVVLRYWPLGRLGRLRAPERLLLGAADRPGPGAKPLPWLGQREGAPPANPTPPSPAPSQEEAAGNP